MGLDCEYVDKRYPRAWYKPYGYILIKGVTVKKADLLKAIAKELKNLRAKSRGVTQQH